MPADAALVVQVSRWDRLKDPRGVLEGFVRGRHLMPDGTHLVLAGPATDTVDDDPEGTEVFGEVNNAWIGLGNADRQTVHLARTADVDRDENSVIVNALQRRADVVVQKSVAEGVGLTVAEAMWKHRPVVASRVGGIQDQIVDPESGSLVDPRTKPHSYGPSRVCSPTVTPLSSWGSPSTAGSARDSCLPTTSLMRHRWSNCSSRDPSETPGSQQPEPSPGPAWSTARCRVIAAFDRRDSRVPLAGKAQP